MSAAVKLADILPPDELAHFEAVSREVDALIAERRRQRVGRKLLPGYRSANQAALKYIRSAGIDAVLKVLPAIEREYTERGWEGELRAVRALDRRLQQRNSNVIWSPYPLWQLLRDVAQL